jgi:protein-disulfide isomerase
VAELNNSGTLILFSQSICMTPDQPQEPQRSSVLSMPVAIIIAGVLIAGAIYFSGSKSTTFNSQATASVPAVAAGNPTQPKPPAAQAADISKVKTAGEPFFGNPNAAVTVAYWYDYQCPFCKKNETDTMPQLIKDYVDTGKVKIVFKDFQFLGADSQTLGKFSHAVWAVAPDKFYQWHKAIFDNQGQENTGWATQDKIVSITQTVLSAGDTSKVTQLVTTNGADYQKIMDADKAEGSAFGVSGTPSFVIGKQLLVGAQPYAALKQLVDLAAQGK